MIVSDAASFLAQGRQISICIVGSGAAGLTMAAELANAGLSVVVLEAGGQTDAGSPVADYRGLASPPHADPSEYRRFSLGGTTALWGGRCVPFDPIDFERRDYVSDSGWPIGYDEVATYYPRAMAHCDAGAFDFSVAGSLPGSPATIAGLVANDVLLSDRIERYSLPTHFGVKYRELLTKSKDVHVLLGARCVRVLPVAGSERIGALEVVTPDLKRYLLNAQTYVLAVGGIEVPRLLLASGVDAGGVAPGNQGGHLGRYYTCHFENLCGKVVPNGTPVVFDFERTSEGVYCRRKFQLSAASQREHALPNVAFRLHFPSYADARHGSSVMSAIYLAKSALVSEYQNILGQYAADDEVTAASAHLKNVVLGVPALLRFGRQWLLERQLAQRKLPYTLVANADGSYPIEFNCEQTPLASSRITLLAERDRHGVPRPAVDWQLCPSDLDAMVRALTLFKTTVEATTPCQVEFDAQALRARLDRSLPVGGHHLGAARMSASPATGVVDSDCAVYGARNLFVASSAVFPTSSHANPTLTIVALAVRLADHLRRRHAGAP